jgi:hypothetical protein
MVIETRHHLCCTNNTLNFNGIAPLQIFYRTVYQYNTDRAWENGSITYLQILNHLPAH